MRPLVVTLAALVGGAVFGAAPASAYELAGRPWPGPTVTYYPRLGAQSDEADRAARAWNKAKVGIAFRRASRDRAQVRISYGSRGCGGRATVGYYGPGARGFIEVGRGCSDGLTFLTVTHELGHVMGLGHERRKCALMNPSADIRTGTPSRCRRRPLSFWVSKPLRSDDIAGARALYRDR